MRDAHTEAMLELVVGAVVVLLIGAGVAVMVGPRLAHRALGGLRDSARRGRSAVRPSPSEPAPNRQVQRILVSASRLATLMRTHGEEEMAISLHEGTRLLATDEPRALRQLRHLSQAAAAIRLSDRGPSERQRQLVVALRNAIHDRAEQLELLPFP